MVVAEIYFDIEFLFQLLMTDEEDVIVPGDRLHLGISFLHASHAVGEGADRYGKYFLKKYTPKLPISVDEEHSFSVLPRINEVSLHVPHRAFFVDVLGSFVDRSLVLDPSVNPFLSSSFGCELFSVRFDFSSIRTFDVCPDRHA